MLVSYWTIRPVSTQLLSVKLLWPVLAISLLGFTLGAADSPFWEYEESTTPYHGILWKSTLPDFSEASYREQVALLLEAFESTTGKRLVPGETGKAALKVFTGSGLGMATPRPLVQALIRALVERGFQRSDLAIVDAREAALRDAGYLPPLSRMEEEGPYFEGVRVYALDRGELRSATWYYESPLPQEFTSPLGRLLLQNPIDLDPEEARKSYLPELLLTGVDFWINLPMASHHPATGLSGALANASLWNISNGSRFFNSPANAPVAVAEVASIPELKARWALNLVSLEAFQFIGGPSFNANYTASLPELWMTVDPVILDANLLQVVNRVRTAAGFLAFPPVPEFIEYSMELGLGTGLFVETQVRRPGGDGQR